MDTTTIERPARPNIQGRHSSLRVSIRNSNRLAATRVDLNAPIDLGAFIERLRSDVFDVYATVREAQRESHLSSNERAAILAAAGHRARAVADAINLFCAVPVLGLDAAEAFGVPI